MLESNDNLNKEIKYSFKRKDGMNIINSLEPYDINIDNDNIIIAYYKCHETTTILTIKSSI